MPMTKAPPLPAGPALPALAQTLAWVRAPLALLDGARARFGSRFTLRFVGGRAYVIVSAPSDVRAVYATPPERFVTANAGMRPFLGNGSMFVVEGEAHRRHRRIVGAPMKGERMRAHAQAIVEATAERVLGFPVGPRLRLVPELRVVALEVIFRVIFGVAGAERRRRLAGLVGELVEAASAPLVFLPALQVDLGPLSPYGAFLRKRGRLRALLAEELAAAKRDHAGRHDVLGRMVSEGLAQGTPLSDDEILDELGTLLGAGHETTTAGLGWAFEGLLSDPSVLARATAEVRARTRGELPTADELEHLPYVDACVNEALRWVAVLPIAPRLLGEDTRIGDLELPAGSYVTPCPHLTHHDPAIFPEPERFRPERFLGGRPSPYEWYPFGGGHRVCIGAQLALYEMRAVVATVLALADLAPWTGRPQRPRRRGITLEPDRGTPVRLERLRG